MAAICLGLNVLRSVVRYFLSEWMAFSCHRKWLTFSYYKVGLWYTSVICQLVMVCVILKYILWPNQSVHFVYGPSQWVTTLHCNVVSHWLGAYTKWSLVPLLKCTLIPSQCGQFAPENESLQLSTLQAALWEWWRHQMDTFSALLAICVGNSPVTSEFLSQRPVMQIFDVFFDLCLNKRLSKHSRGWWFGMLSCPLWCHCNGKPWWVWSGIVIAVLRPSKHYLKFWNNKKIWWLFLRYNARILIFFLNYT